MPPLKLNSPARALPQYRRGEEPAFQVIGAIRARVAAENNAAVIRAARLREDTRAGHANRGTTTGNQAAGKVVCPVGRRVAEAKERCYWLHPFA